MRSTPLVWLVLLVLVPQLAMAVGTCTLDQDIYYSGETATLECLCTSATEHNAAGYIVFKNNNGSILQNVSTNSGQCTTSPFGDSYTFTQTNINGSAYFETADTDWLGAGDNRTDHFQLLSTNQWNCIINQITSPGTFNLGETGAVKIDVIDSVTGHNIVNARCRSEAYDINEAPLLAEPYDDFILSTAGGEAVFMHTMSEDFWNPNQSYIYEFHCHCPANSTITIPEERCYDETMGTAFGFKACSVQALFTTGTDNRPLNGTKDLTFLWIAALLPFFLGVVLMCSSFIFGPQHAVLKVFLFFVPFLGFFASMQMTAQTLIRYYGFDDLVNSISDVTYWSAMMLFVILSYILVYFIVVLGKSILTKGKTEFEL